MGSLISGRIAIRGVTPRAGKPHKKSIGTGLSMES
jgi:hypothetical protein